MAAGLYRAQTADARQILIAMGMGEFNATMVIPYLFIPPATTDADMAQVIMLVELIQRRCNSLGAKLSITGRLDPPTVATLDQMLGPNWPRMSWYEVCRGLIAKTDHLIRAEPGSRGRAQAMSGILPDLPELPGIVYIALGAVGYHYFMKRKRS